MKNILPVAIVSANYNNGKYLVDFFDSIIDSNVLPEQICIVDDGSNDNSVSIIESYREKVEQLDIKFSFILFEKNQGFGLALNKAISLVEAEFSLRLDPDDLLHNERISVQYNYMIANPTCAVLGSNIEYFLSDTKKKLRLSSVPISTIEIKKLLKLGCIPLIHGSTMLKTSLFESFLYRPDTVPAEDYDLFSRMSEKGIELHNIKDILTFVRVHDASVTNSLPYETIEKTFLLREEIWRVKFSFINAKRRYFNQRFYRKYLFKSGFVKWLYFIMAALCWPESVIRNIKLRFKK